MNRKLLDQRRLVHSSPQPFLPVAQIDPLLTAELLVVLLVVATMDSPPPQEHEAQPPPEEPAQPLGWAAETDLHAQRILRLERRRIEGAAAPRLEDGSHASS